jgi:hypothetical protein
LGEASPAVEVIAFLLDRASHGVIEFVPKGDPIGRLILTVPAVLGPAPWWLFRSTTITVAPWTEAIGAIIRITHEAT